MSSSSPSPPLPRAEHIPKGPRRLKPLNAEKRGPEHEGLEELRGVIFDVDGTLCEPQTYMFALMRNALQIPKSVDILGHIHSLPEAEQEAAHEAIKQIERDAMVKQTPQPGLVELMTYLDSHGLPKGILTRNFDAPVTHLLEKFLPEAVFEPIITRSFHPPKPRPEGIWHIVEKWGMGVGAEGAKGVIMVGDSLDDMTAGRLAGAATVLLRNDVNGEVAEHEHTDLVVSRLDDLVKILEDGFMGRET